MLAHRGVQLPSKVKQPFSNERLQEELNDLEKSK